MIQLQPETKAAIVVSSLLRAGAFCPVEEFKCEASASGDAVQALEVDPCNSARFIVASGKPGTTGSIDMVLHLPSGGALKKSYPVSVIQIGEDPDDFEIAIVDA